MWYYAHLGKETRAICAISCSSIKERISLFLETGSLHLHFMKSIKAYISTILTVVILAGSLLPALHAFDHEGLSSESDPVLNLKFSKASVDCELCDFRVANADAPSAYVYEMYSPQREVAFSISLAETVNLFPNPLFSLRAPPVVIS